MNHCALRGYRRLLVGLPVLLLLLALLAPLTPLHAQLREEDKTTVKLYALWWGQSRGTNPTDPMLILMRDDPSIRVQEWAGLTLPGGAGRVPLMLGLAGQNAPDLYYSWFHIIRNDIQQKFLYPLNEWIGEDANGDGQIDPHDPKEVTPELIEKFGGKNHENVWARAPEINRQVATMDGKIWGLPTVAKYYMGIIYRTDLVKQAGLDPNEQPQDWDEFFYFCQRLTTKSRWALALPCYGFTWLPWLNSAGGTPVVQYKMSLDGQRKIKFPMEATEFIDPETQDNLIGQPSTWQADLNSDAAKLSVWYYQKLRWQRWIRDAHTREPVNLEKEDVNAKCVYVVQNAKGRLDRVKAGTPGARKITFIGDDVFEGVARGWGGSTAGLDWGKDLGRGTVVMVQWFYNDLPGFQSSSGVNPELLSVMAIPGAPKRLTPHGNRVIQLQRHFAVMTEGVGRRPKAEQNKIWTVLRELTSAAAADQDIRTKVTTGKARFVNPADLRRLGYHDYIREIPISLQNLYRDIDNGTILTRTEPFMGYWVAMDAAINSNVTGIVLAQGGEYFDYKKALDNVNATANNGTMFARSEEQIAPKRSWAMLIFVVVLALVLFFVAMIVKTNLTAKVKTLGNRAGVYKAWLPWVMLIPALGLITLWGYYPLTRGAVMAFQDYHIVGDSPWKGLDNFISIFMNKDFIDSIWTTIKFVGWSLLLVFTAPILLSLMLSEIPWGKVFWRSVFFLPQLTSGLVIALLFKLMYNNTDAGLFNQMSIPFFKFLNGFHNPFNGDQTFLQALEGVRLFAWEPFKDITGMIKPQDWLGDKRFAMLMTIIPTVWAGMGISSLIYLAALKGIPEELYEAADLDGASTLSKLRFITFPQLAPLIIINFVGAFIATFQSMGNIFLLTFGGPANETMVMGMLIWMEAYANLRFSIATSVAWVLGSALIGFAYLQINILRKVEFRRVEEV